MGLIVVRDGRAVRTGPADDSTSQERAARANDGNHTRLGLAAGVASTTADHWTEQIARPRARNALYQLKIQSQELSPAPRATSPAYRSDKRRQSTPSPKAAAAPLDAMAQHWLLATLVATALALVPPATTAPGLTKLSAYVPSGPSRRPTQISRRFKSRPRPQRGLHAVDAAPARRRGGAVL